MKPVTPPLPPGTTLIVFAKDQPEYTPLPAAVSPNGAVMTEWEPSAEDLATLMNGGRVRLWIMLYGQQCPHCHVIFGPKLQPVAVEAVENEQGTGYDS